MSQPKKQIWIRRNWSKFCAAAKLHYTEIKDLVIVTAKAQMKAFFWVLAICTILFLPYLASAYIDYMTYICDEDIKGFLGTVEFRILEDMQAGPFLFVPIGVSSAAYIDYVFERRTDMIPLDLFIHLSFFILLIAALSIYICCELKNAVNDPNLFSLESDNVINHTWEYLKWSTYFAFIVKTLVFSHRTRDQLYN